MVIRKLGLYLMGAAALCMVAGCSADQEQRNCEVMGAGIGAVAGAGIATAVILTTKNHGSNEGTYFSWGIPAGLAGGGLIGGMIGHYLCPPALAAASGTAAATASSTAATASSAAGEADSAWRAL